MPTRHDIVVKSPKGPHIQEALIDPSVRHAEVDQVIALATAAIPRAQMRKLGRLFFAHARDDDDQSYIGQIRSEPIGSSELEFRFPVPARDTGRSDPAVTAARLAEGAIHLAKVAGRLGKLSTDIREIADRALKPATGGIAAMRLRAVGITPCTANGRTIVTVDVEMLGDDLAAGIDRISETTDRGGLARLDEKLGQLAARHVVPRQVLARAKVAGGSGWVDDSALRIVDAAGLDRREALGMLRHSRQVRFSFGRENGYDLWGGVHWEDGTIRGYVENRERGEHFSLEDGGLTIGAERLPATITSTLTGRHLGEVVDTDLIPGSALIVEVEESDEWLHLRLVIGDALIEHAIPPAGA